MAKHLPVDLDAENLSVIACGGKTAIPYHARLCRALGIPVCVLFDDDTLPEPDGVDPSRWTPVGYAACSSC
jgi:predicted ATP-dependent endonuclease of OLD family